MSGVSIADRALLATLSEFDQEHGGFPLAAIEKELVGPYMALFYAAEGRDLDSVGLKAQVDRLIDSGLLKLVYPSAIVDLPGGTYHDEPAVVVADEWFAQYSNFDYGFDDDEQRRRALRFTKDWVGIQTRPLSFECCIIENLPIGWNPLPQVETVLDDRFARLLYYGPGYDRLELIQGERLPPPGNAEHEREVIVAGTPVRTYEVRQTSIWVDVVHEWARRDLRMRMSLQRINGVNSTTLTPTFVEIDNALRGWSLPLVEGLLA